MGPQQGRQAARSGRLWTPRRGNQLQGQRAGVCQWPPARWASNCGGGPLGVRKVSTSATTSAQAVMWKRIVHSLRTSCVSARDRNDRLLEVRRQRQDKQGGHQRKRWP